MALTFPALPAGRALHPERFLVLNSVRHCVYPCYIVLLEGSGKLKIVITWSGTEPVTFWPQADMSVCVILIAG
jgi:hypothetical protein